MGEHHHHEEHSDHGHSGHHHHGHHHHGHHHHGHHHHGHSPDNYNRAFLISVVLNSGFVAIEAIYGILANSLALLADAGHNFSDVLGLVLVWGASVLARRRPTPRRTYGMRRSSILAALVNASALLLVCGGIVWEAVQRLRSPDLVAGNTIIIVALIGILINTVSALMFVSGQSDLNIRGAFLHLAADALVSLGVVIAGLTIATTGWLWVDPIVSLIVTAVIVWGTWQLFRDSFNLMLDAVPEHVDPLAVRQYLAERSGVNEVHDLHIWAMSTTETALTAHLVMLEGHPGDGFLSMLCNELREKFNIAHSTVQIETGDPEHPCVLAPDHVL
jgi:cobalt-zinc-cadmium efflux system protein